LPHVYKEHGVDKVQAAMADGFDREAQRHDQERHKANGRSNTTAKDWRGHIVTAAELQRKEFPPISYVVPDLIPEGLSILAGRPKVGKSWLALDVGIAVAAKRICLGDRRPAQGVFCTLPWKTIHDACNAVLTKYCHPSARIGQSD
jgi:RecA-family ATPase